MTVRYVPTVLSDDLSFVQAEIDRYSQLNPQPERVQIDILDGHFADNLTIEARDIDKLDMHGMLIDLHLMVIEPADHLSEVKDTEGLGIIIGQIERMSSIDAFVEVVTQDMELEAGVALDLYTPFDSLMPATLEQVAVVQLLANKAGYAGQEFHPHTLDKIREVAAYRQEHQLDFALSIDIGMDAHTIPQVREAGATMIVMNSFLQGEEGWQRWQALHQQ